MSRLVPVLCVATVAGIALTAWSQLSAGNTTVDVPTGGATKIGAAAIEDELLVALREARRRCSLPALDTVVSKLQTATTGEQAAGKTWRLLADAYLERAQQRTHLRGMAVGEPLFSELPQAHADDLKAGLAAVAKARELGDESGELCRIEAGLMSQCITGLTSALKWNGKIGEALQLAAERGADQAKLHMALGLRKLLAPRWFGHDPEAALEHFTFAAKASDDERPAVFAGMANYLQKKRQQAIDWLQQAVDNNPDNKFARVVLRRLQRGEDDPFGRDVSEAEVAAAR